MQWYTEPIVALLTSANKTDQSLSRWQVIDGYHRYLLSQKNTLKKTPQWVFTYYSALC
ncbi:hypothetical protein [Providencia rettgeri]|uniref:hypothetical protein n=1 Tax=Providencia rettgeri TaxID=587 RepID=UPI0013743C97|nr:hypothetical protein BML2531_01010 [Providencia rettgeri]